MPPIETEIEQSTVLKKMRIVVVVVTVVAFVLLLFAYIWGPQLLRTSEPVTNSADTEFNFATDIKSLTGRIVEIGDGYIVLGLQNIPPTMDPSLENRRVILSPGIIVERMRLRSDADREPELRAFYVAMGMPFEGDIATSLPPGFKVDTETGNAYLDSDATEEVTAVEANAASEGEVTIPGLPARYTYEVATIQDLTPGMEVAVVAQEIIFSAPTFTPERIIIHSD